MANNGAIEDLPVRALSHFVGNDGSGRAGRQPTNSLVPTSRQVVGDAGLTGGGQLSSDVTIGLDSASVASLALADSALQPGTGVPQIASRAALASFDPLESSIVYITEMQKEGVFSWSSANLTSQIAIDPAQGIFVPPVSDPSGASGAWVRTFSGNIWAKWFGMSSANTAAANVAALQAAINFASQIIFTILVNKYVIATSDVVIDRGLFQVELTTNIPTGVRVIGQGKSNTMLQHAGGAAYVFTYTAAAGVNMYNAWVLDLAIYGSGITSSDTLGAISAQTTSSNGLAIYGCGMRNCLVSNTYDGVFLEMDWTFEVVECQMYNVGRNFLRGLNITSAKIVRNRLDLSQADGIYITYGTSTSFGTYALHLEANIIQGCQQRAIYGVDAAHVMWDHNYLESNNQAGGFPAVEFASVSGTNAEFYSFSGGWVSPGSSPNTGQPAFLIAKARMVSSHGVYIRGSTFSTGWSLGSGVEGYSIDGEFNGGPFVTVDPNTTGIAISRVSLSISGVDSETQTVSTSGSSQPSSLSVRIQDLDCTSGAKTFTLQDAHLQLGRRFTVQKTDGGSNALIIAPESGGAGTFINGANAPVNSTAAYARAEITCGLVAGTSTLCWFVKFT